MKEKINQTAGRLKQTVRAVGVGIATLPGWELHRQYSCDGYLDACGDARHESHR